MPADAGIRFGQYVLVRRIARGGMAEVFLAQQRGLEGFDRRVAVKRILPHLADSPDFVKMFLGEARLAAQLAHPNIVHIYEFGKVANDYFIAMEFVDGVHAGELFKHAERERLPPTLVARIGADAAAALYYAHELRGADGKRYGLVHRDVSPANIMISFDGVVKLCDFGIAKAAAAGDQLTNPGQVKGKYAYMSPEQTTANQLDGRSDVFSLGIVLWELLTGKYIVPRGDAVAAMRAIRDGKLEPIGNVAPDVPAALAQAVMAALETKRDARATAMQLATSLEAFIKSSPEIATSMQVAAFVRERFTREGTGQHQAISSNSPGTHAAPGTIAAPGTAAAPASVIVTPSVITPANVTITPEAVAAQPMMSTDTSPVYPARRRVIKVVQDATEGTEIYSTSDLEDSATVMKPRSPMPWNTPSNAATVIARPPQPPNRADEATVHAGRPIMVGDATEVVDARHLPHPAADEEDSAASATFMETTERDPETPPERLPPTTRKPSAHAPPPPRPSMPSPPAGYNLAALSNQQRTTHTIKGTGTQSVLSRKQSSPDMLARPRQTPEQHAAQRRRRMLFTIGGLGGLMLLSFMIALAASNSGQAVTAPQDAGVIQMTTVDALPLAPPPLDAALAPTVPTVPAVAPAAPVEAAMAYLVVRTIPDGGTVKIGDQTRVAAVQPGDPTGAATAQLLVEAGRHTVTAELSGYQPEKRDVVLDKGENKTIEITFTKKIVERSDRGPSMGRLTVRTTPWSDVYLGGKKLGQAPFADLQVPVGTHKLTFKNPSRPTVTKTVTIRAGKSSKLNFSLP